MALEDSGALSAVLTLITSTVMVEARGAIKSFRDPPLPKSFLLYLLLIFLDAGHSNDLQPALDGARPYDQVRIRSSSTRKMVHGTESLNTSWE